MQDWRAGREAHAAAPDLTHVPPSPGQQPSISTAASQYSANMPRSNSIEMNLPRFNSIEINLDSKNRPLKVYPLTLPTENTVKFVSLLNGEQ